MAHNYVGYIQILVHRYKNSAWEVPDYKFKFICFNGHNLSLLHFIVEIKQNIQIAMSFGFILFDV